MRLFTHQVFSLGAGTFLVSRLGFDIPGTYVLAFWLALSTNYLIDAVGHRNRGGRPVRTWVAHSIFTAPLWGAGLGLVTVYALETLRFVGGEPSLLFFSAVLGAFIAYSHLLLDSMTEGGVFLAGSRIALSHWRNNGLLVNWAFVLCGALLTAAALIQPW